MSDIIEQLDEAMREGAGELAEQAKAEIERLRAINADLEQRIRLASPAWAEEAREWVAEMQRLRAIRDELVAALEQIMNPSVGYPRIAPGLNEIARAAIAKAKEQNLEIAKF